MSGRRGHTIDSSESTSVSQQSSASPPPRFTFVNQSEDLQAVASKKLKDKKQRHQIRSHVMRGVRQHELALGKKRPTGREHVTPSGTGKTKEIAVSPAQSSVASDAVILKLSASPHASPVRASPTTNYWIDPFNSLPSGDITHESMNTLLQHCFTHFIPQSFPVESSDQSEVLARRETIWRSKTTNPALFFGLLAAIAVHRAIAFGLHKDLGPLANHDDELVTDDVFKSAKQTAISMTRSLMQAGDAPDIDLLEACFGLVAISCMIGNFVEATTHLKGAQKVWEKVGLSGEAPAWLTMCDIRAAVGLLTRPVVRLPWVRVDVPQEIRNRIHPPDNSPLARLGSGFFEASRLSRQLRDLVPDAALVCRLCELSTTSTHGLSKQEQATFRCKAQELESDILTYVYNLYPLKDGKPDVSAMPPIEMIVRVGILGLLSLVATFNHAASGVGRATTHHQRNALGRWLRHCHEQPSMAENKIVTWALFIFIACAEDQREQVGFERTLAQVTRSIWLMNWDEVESTLYEFLYIPHVQRSSFMRMWDDVQRFNRP